MNHISHVTVLENREPDSHKDTIKLLTDNLEIALAALSQKNRKEYERTFEAWTSYCTWTGFDKYDFELMKVKEYLTNNDWSFNTRKVRLAHLRKYAEILAMADRHNQYGYAFNFGRLALLKPKTLGGNKEVIPMRSLTHKQVYKVFDSLIGDNNQKTRNRAVLGLLFLAGLRSSEVVSLKWEHVVISERLLYIFEGKGDKSVHIPMLGDLPQILSEWQVKQSESGIYDYVCCSIFRSDKLGDNKKVASRMISTIIQNVSRDTGIDFRPHDTRRTAITALLDAGASVPETRDFARHSSGETTLRYAQKSTAKALGTSLKNKLKYGDVLGEMEAGKQARIWECSNHHKFLAINPICCENCNSTELSYQISLFD